MSHFYLVASLPGLALGATPPLTVAQFRSRADGVLGTGELHDLDSLLEGLPGEGTSAFCRRWSDLDTQLRNAIARQRAAAAGAEAPRAPRAHVHFSVFVEKAVADALTRGDPLEREMALDRCRWELLEDLAREQPFGLSAVLAWAGQLQIAERWSSMEVAAGRENVRRIVEANLKDRA